MHNADLRRRGVDLAFLPLNLQSSEHARYNAPIVISFVIGVRIDGRLVDSKILKYIYFILFLLNNFMHIHVLWSDGYARCLVSLNPDVDNLIA